jgi:hypothetical protein
MSKKISLFDFNEFDRQLRDAMKEMIQYSKELDDTFKEYKRRFGIDLNG